MAHIKICRNFDYEVKITPVVCGQYLEISIENTPAYRGEFPHYGAAACFAEQFLMDEYRKREHNETLI